MEKTSPNFLHGSIRKQSRKTLTAKRHLLRYRVLRSTKERFGPLPCICRLAAVLRCIAVLAEPPFSYVARAFCAAPIYNVARAFPDSYSQVACAVSAYQYYTGRCAEISMKNASAVCRKNGPKTGDGCQKIQLCAIQKHKRRQM